MRGALAGLPRTAALVPIVLLASGVTPAFAADRSELALAPPATAPEGSAVSVPVPSASPSSAATPPVVAPADSGASLAHPPPPPVPPADGAAAPAPPPAVGPVPTADASPPASDHDAVVRHLGIEARHVDPGPLPLTLRPGFGCPAAATAACNVTMGALAVRYWATRNLAWNGGLALAAGGGREGMVALDTHFGIGPLLGLTLLLGNWRHLAVGASPEIGIIWFRPGDGVTRNTTIVNLRAALEAELHFGFVGVPALSVGLLAGLNLQYESAADARLWSIGVIGAGSIWGTLSNLFVRYYL
jgi:hypothetical protein